MSEDEEEAAEEAAPAGSGGIRRDPAGVDWQQQRHGTLCPSPLRAAFRGPGTPGTGTSGTSGDPWIRAPGRLSHRTVNTCHGLWWIYPLVNIQIAIGNGDYSGFSR